MKIPILILIILSFLSCIETASKNEQNKFKKPIFAETELLKEVYGDDHTNAKVNFSKTITIYGSLDKLNFIETETSTESSINYTGKAYIITNKDNEILLKLLGNEYMFEKIFPYESPFLIITEITFKGNGIHHFYGVENNKIKDFLNTNNWEIQTIGRKNMQEVYIPSQLNLTFEDVNKDSIPDAVFSGEVLNVITNKKNDISLVFIYDSKLKLFELKK